MSLRALSRLGAVVAGLLLLVLAVPASPAAAVDATGCRIAPGATFTFSPFCVNDRAATSYSVAFHAPDGAAGYAWSVTGDWTGVVVTGCGSTNAYCTVRTAGSNTDREVSGTVLVDGTTTYTSHAYIRAFCGSQLC